MISYALAIGCALALIGLYCEAAQHFNWSRRQKGWGGIILLIGAMGVVPVIAERVNEIALAAACSCIVLALGMRGNQTVVVKRVETKPVSQPDWIETPAAESAEEILHNTPPLTAEVVPHPTTAAAQPVIAEETHDDIEEEEAVVVAVDETRDEIIVEEEAAIIAEETHDEIVIEEAVIVIAEETRDAFIGEIIEEVIAFSEEIDEVFVEEEDVIEDEMIELMSDDTGIEVAVPVDETVSIPSILEPELTGAELAEWLNEQIAAGYEAKAGQAFAQAARHFEAAFLRSDDFELVAMLQDELADCCRELELRGESHHLRYAS